MKTWHAHLRRTVKLIEFTYEDCNVLFFFFSPTAKEKRMKRECDILAPRLSARHEFYFCVKDAEKTCKYVILSVQGVFYKFFCTSMTTGIIIIGFYYYIFSMVLYKKNLVELQDSGGKNNLLQWEMVEDSKDARNGFENLGCLLFRNI